MQIFGEILITKPQNNTDTQYANFRGNPLYQATTILWLDKENLPENVHTMRPC